MEPYIVAHHFATSGTEFFPTDPDPVTNLASLKCVKNSNKFAHTKIKMGKNLTAQFINFIFQTVPSNVLRLIERKENKIYMILIFFFF